jgi:hypothetical protein
MPTDVRHYVWAGLDFLIDRQGTPVLIEANRASHMLGEYVQFIGDERPFELTAGVMNRAASPPCLLWRRDDPLPEAGEDACFIGERLMKHLAEPAVICNVEENQEPRTELVARDGRQVRPGSIFRWWYGLPWTYERSGATVINPNSVWMVVRDKLVCSQLLAGAKSFRVPRSFAVESAADVRALLAGNPELFSDGYVVRPRVGWGGHGVQVAARGEEPRGVGGNAVLSERIIPTGADGRFREVRAFVMDGVYLGGIIHSSSAPNMNYWQGGTPEPLDESTRRLLEAPSLESVALIDAAANRIQVLPDASTSPLTEVNYEGIGMPGLEGAPSAKIPPAS